MAVLPYLAPSVLGTTYTTTAASAGGDKISPVTGIVLVTNGSGASITVTVDVPGNDKYGIARPDIAITIAAGAAKLIGPFPSDLANPSDGMVNLSYSAVTSVTVGAIADFQTS